MTVTAVLITPNEPSEVIEIELNTKTLQDLVAGQIECIDGPDWTAYLNEEGKVIGQASNKVATDMANTLGWDHPEGDFLVGPVVFVGPVEKGAGTSASPEVIELARVLSRGECS